MTPERVERFFQFSLLGLVASGYFALAGSGYLDQPSIILTGAVLVLRALFLARVLLYRIPARMVAILALGYLAFYPLDFFFLSHDFLQATVHGVCFLAAVKVLTASTNRDYVYTGAIAFIELVAAALLSSTASFVAFLGLYLLFTMAAFTSAEIRRSLETSGNSASSAAPGLPLRLAAVSVAATFGILVITAGLFLIVPRTARAAALLFPHSAHLTGFSTEINLGNFGEIGNDDRPVMHIQPYARSLPANLKWRGAAWSRFDGRRWSEPPLPSREIAAGLEFTPVADEWQRSRRDGQRVMYHVDVENPDTGTLFIAGTPEFLHVDSPRLFRIPEDSFRVTPPPAGPLQYEVSAYVGPPLSRPLTAGERARYLQLPPLNTRIWTLARGWAGDGGQMLRATRVQNHLRNDFGYTLRLPAASARDPLSDFLFGRKQGHCEYFASAMAVMLRTMGIPSRVASGFQSGYFNDVSKLYVVRGSDAHAWVEGYIDGLGWTTFDPTPSSRNPPPRSAWLTRANMYLDAMDHAWQEWVISYDLGRQATLAARFEALLRKGSRGWPSLTPARWTAASIARAKAWGSAGVSAALLIALLVLVGPRAWRSFASKHQLRRIQGGPGSAGDASVLYARMLEALARRGLHKPDWFTPIEFVKHLPPGENTAVAQFTALYNEMRFGMDSGGKARLIDLLQQIESRPKDNSDKYNAHDCFESLFVGLLDGLDLGK